MNDRDKVLSAVMEEAKERERRRTSMETKQYDFEVFDRYCALCNEIGVAPLPVFVPSATAYLLMRSAEGAADCDLSNEMRFIVNFHLLCDAQIRPFGDVKTRAVIEFNRALGHAILALSGKGISIFDMKLASAKKAFEMFPNGVVPKVMASAA